jgi:hypothetical protein
MASVQYCFAFAISRAQQQRRACAHLALLASSRSSALPGPPGAVVLRGIDVADHSGYSVSGAGDVNGDGCSTWLGACNDRER